MIEASRPTTRPSASISTHFFYGKPGTELEQGAARIERPRRGPAQKIDVEIGGHGERHWPDMGQNDDIGCQIGQGEQGRARQRATRAQMAMRRLQPQDGTAGADGLDMIDPAVLIDLRKFPVEKVGYFFRVHDGLQVHGGSHSFDARCSA